ncbi:MAG: pyridoxal-phosphate dependent enzyme [Chlamydiota bacterium]
MTRPDLVCKLQELCTSHISSSFNLHSRAHKMQKVDLYVKRDDELSFSVSGSKLRKYASLLPILKKKNATVALVGSPYSNHILSLVQLLKQEGLSYQLFLEKPKTGPPQGNFFFLSLLLSPKDVIWVEKAPNSLTESWTKAQEEILQNRFFWVPMGGCMKEGFFGALTLALDILTNEKELEEDFSRIFVDAGTGLTAAALILGLSYIQKKSQITVVLLAGTKESFFEQLLFFKSILEEALQEHLPPINNYQVTFPATAKSFGSCNKKVFETITQVAREEGIFLDPLYTAKLYLTAKESIGEKSSSALWIHSGGALSLSGFQEPLLKSSDFTRLFYNLLK